MQCRGQWRRRPACDFSPEHGRHWPWLCLGALPSRRHLLHFLWRRQSCRRLGWAAGLPPLRGCRLDSQRSQPPVFSVLSVSSVVEASSPARLGNFHHRGHKGHRGIQCRGQWRRRPACDFSPEPGRHWPWLCLGALPSRRHLLHFLWRRQSCRRLGWAAGLPPLRGCRPDSRRSQPPVFSVLSVSSVVEASSPARLGDFHHRGHKGHRGIQCRGQWRSCPACDFSPEHGRHWPWPCLGALPSRRLLIKNADWTAGAPEGPPVPASHPHHAYLHLRDFRVEAHAQPQGQRAAGLVEPHNAVVPQARGAVIRATLVLIGLQRRALELRLLLKSNPHVVTNSQLFVQEQVGVDCIPRSFKLLHQLKPPILFTIIWYIQHSTIV